MHVDIDRSRLAAYRLTVQDVEDAIRRQNAEIPAGRIESQARERAAVISEKDDALARLGEVNAAQRGQIEFLNRQRDVYHGENQQPFGVGRTAVSDEVLRQFRTLPISVDAEQPGQLKQIRPGNAWVDPVTSWKARDGT